MPLRLPKSRTARALLLLGLTAAFALVMTGAIALMFPTQALGSSSTLEVLDGAVAVSRDGSTFAMGQDGDMLQEGDVIRTGEGAHAVLTFFDGSVIELEPDSEIRVETLQATTAGDLLMTMQQTIGRSWHVVSRTLSPNSKYEVRTPAATAAVRGTAFLVTVTPHGFANVQTTDGVVGMTGGGQEVLVPAGFQSSVPPGGVPEPTTAAPPPPAVVRIVLDPTPNAAVVDAFKRTVGVINGFPIRYIPGSTVALIDGKLVITIPNPTLGRLDTHVQPADPNDLVVNVNVQVQVGDVVVGNVIERRGVGANGVAKGGVVLTTTGTVLLPDSDVKTSEDPRIGRLPPPPPSGPTLVARATPGPTMIVTPPPSFVSRVAFDPRVTLATATPTPAPTTSVVFNGAYQPYATKVEASATPAPNSSLTLFSSSTELTTLRLVSTPTPTPAPTLGLQLTSPFVALTPAPAFNVLVATPSPVPTVPPFILATLPPLVFATVAPNPTPTAPPFILATLPPILFQTLAPTPAPTAPPLILATLPPFIFQTVPPTPAPTAPPFIIQTLPPRIIATPTPAPTAPPIIFQTLPPIFIATPTPTPTPLPLRTVPRCIPGVTC